MYIVDMYIIIIIHLETHPSIYHLSMNETEARYTKVMLKFTLSWTDKE